MAVINMSKKIDHYMKDKALYQTDLNLQHKEWKQNLIIPYGSCYTEAYNRVNKKIDEAKKEKKKHDKKMKEIAELHMAICLFVLDIAASSALSKVAGAVSRLQSKKSIDYFLTDNKSAGEAAASFLRQSDTFADVVIGNLASKSLDAAKSKGLMDGFKKAVTAGKSDIATTVVDFSRQAKDPLVHQNDMLMRLSRCITGVEKIYINGVRDVQMPDDVRRAFLLWLTTVPIARPPAHTFPSTALTGKMEVLLWVDMVLAAARHTTAEAKAKKKEVPFILVDFDRFIARKMNDHFKKNTKYHLKRDGYGTGREPPFNYQFHGTVYKSHLEGLHKMAAEAAQFIGAIVQNMHTAD